MQWLAELAEALGVFFGAVIRAVKRRIMQRVAGLALGLVSLVLAAVSVVYFLWGVYLLLGQWAGPTAAGFIEGGLLLALAGGLMAWGAKMAS